LRGTSNRFGVSLQALILPSLATQINHTQVLPVETRLLKLINSPMNEILMAFTASAALRGAASDEHRFVLAFQVPGTARILEARVRFDFSIQTL
jgi:hypothetical protein